MRLSDLPPRLREQAERQLAPRSRAPSAPSGPETPQDAEMRPYAPGGAEVPVRGWEGRQTEVERRYNAEALGGKGRFEAVTLHLPGGCRYTPDFMTIDDGVPTFHEVKGAYRLPSQGRAWTAFREAAAAFPIWRFVWAAERARADGGGFSVKEFYVAHRGFDIRADCSMA